MPKKLREKQEALSKYSAKRKFSQTPEPPAKVKGRKATELQFVVQKHSARRLHYDFRLEHNGVLVSWAVPKGPSSNPTVKRLAVMVEDHPFDYRNFEGVIPEGQYGAGPVIVWDNGRYYPVDEAKKRDQIDKFPSREQAEDLVQKGLEKGKLSFVLQGTKLKGEWALVKLKNTKNDWLLIKHRDQFAHEDEDLTELDRSVISDSTVEKLNNDGKVGKHSRPAKKASAASHFPPVIEPMLSSLADEPFSKAGWLYEPKFDGIRVIAIDRGDKVQLQSRRGLDLSAKYPTIAKALLKMGTNAILDGEIVALDSKGRPSFQLLQNSGEGKVSLFYYVFDILALGNKDLTSLPLSERKRLLHTIKFANSSVRLVEALNCDGLKAFDVCIKNGLEGVVAKRIDSLYEMGHRSPNWLKVKNTQSAEFLICGYTEGAGARQKAFGALLLGYYDKNGHLNYAGNVGTGFDQAKLKELQRLMKPLKIAKQPFEKPIKIKATWLKPKLVAEIKFAEWTQDKMLRSPVFLHLREDVATKQAGPAKVVQVNAPKSSMKKNAKDKDDANDVLSQLEQQKQKTTLSVEVDGHKINLTSLDKVMWPAGKGKEITKLGYLSYLMQVAPFLLDHLRARPMTLIRFPNGMGGERFFQKHWHHKLPDFVSTVRHYSEHTDKDQDYLVCDNVATLVWLAQIANLEIHTAHTRLDPEPDAKNLSVQFTGSVQNIDSSLLNYPDYVVLDLDPYLYSGKEKKGAEPELNRIGFQKTCEIAISLKEMLDQLEIVCFVKTSGRTGLHIYLPIVRNIDYDSVRAVAETIGHHLLEKHPKDLTMEWSVAKRTGKIFFDHNMNARGKTLASIYSARSSPEASISAAVDWRELTKIYPTDFTIKTMPSRLEKIGDLWADILLHKNDLRKLLILNR